MAERDRLTGEIVDAALKLHRALGPGLLESVYEALLAKELERRGLRPLDSPRYRLNMTVCLFEMRSASICSSNPVSSSN